MLLFIDETGKHHSAVVEVKETNGVNGEKSLRGTIYSNEQVIESIGRGWKVKFNKETFNVTYALPVDQGNRNEVEFDAVHEFFYDMQKSVVYSLLNGSNTMLTYLDFIFKDSGYTYNLEENVLAFEKQNFGMKNRLSLFKDIIKSTGLEFSVNGKVVRILKKVGTDLSTVVKKGFNLNDLKIEKNTNSFITYLKGYGAYLDEEDHSKGRIEAEYLSPLAAIYGKLEGDPVSDERYSIAESLTKRLEDEVNNSYNISVSLNMEDLISAGYEYERPHEGDYIMAINDDLHFRQKIRIISYTTSFDINGNIIDHDVTAGSDSLVDKSRGNQNDRLSNIESDLGVVLENSNKALVSANGKNTVYYGPDEPENSEKLKTGDIWYQVVGEETIMKFWNGYEWELFFDPKANTKLIDDAFREAEEAKSAAETSYTEAVEKATNLVTEKSIEWNENLNGLKVNLETQLVNLPDSLINTAWINKLYADSIFSSNLKTTSIEAVSANITSIITNHLTADTISSSMIKADIGLIDKLFATTASIERLTTKSAFIQSVQAIDISANRIKSGTIDASDVNIINLNVNRLVGNITSFIQSNWNGINNRISITSDGLESSRSDGSISAKYLSDGIQIWGGGKWSGSLSWASGPSVVLWAKKSHTLHLGYQGNSTATNSYYPALEISGDTGVVKTYSDIQMNGKALIGVKYFAGDTYFNGTGNLEVWDNRVLRFSRFGTQGYATNGTLTLSRITIGSTGGTAIQNTAGSSGIWIGDGGKFMIRSRSAWYDMHDWLFGK